jgi:tetratricopeptide (TPR) repeat protein
MVPPTALPPTHSAKSPLVPAALLRRAAVLLLAAGLIPSVSGCLRNSAQDAAKIRRESFDLLTRGQQLKDRGDYLIARDVLLQSYARSPRPVTAYEVGNCYYRLGRFAEAREWHRNALQLEPGYVLAQAELELVEAALPPAPTNGLGDGRNGLQPLVTETKADDKETGPTISQEPAAPVEEELLPTPSPTPVPTPTPRPAILPAVSEQAPAPAPATTINVPAAATPTPTPRPTTPGTTSIFEPAMPAATGGMGFMRAFGNVGAPSANMDERTIAVLNNPALAREVVFPELASDAPRTQEEQLKQAEEAERVGRFDEAVRVWSRLVSEDAQSVAYRLGLANALYRSGRSLRAEQEYAVASSLAPNDPKVQYEVGNFLVTLGEKESARLAFRRTVELDPTNLRALNNLGVTEMDLGDLPAATAIFRRVIEADPRFEPAWLNLALALDNAGRPASEVRDALETYSRLTPVLDSRTERWLRDVRQRANAGR